MPPISQATIQQHLAAGDNAQVAIHKGRHFENLIDYIFSRIPGVRLTRRDALNTFDSEEIDLAFWNERRDDGLYFLPHIILVECKNWSKAVDSSEVSWFDSKLRRRSMPFGILVAANNITGDANQVAAAHEIIRQALGEGRQHVVITRREIEALNSTEQLVELIQRKLCELAVSGTLFL